MGTKIIIDIKMMKIFFPISTYDEDDNDNFFLAIIRDMIFKHR